MTVVGEVKPGHLWGGDGEQEEEGEDGGHGEGWSPGEPRGNHDTSLLSETNKCFDEIFPKTPITEIDFKLLKISCIVLQRLVFSNIYY